MQSNTRHNIFKTPMSDAEIERLRRLCAKLKKQCAPVVRELIEQACDQLEASAPCNSKHPIAARANREWPRHGHVASARPARPARGHGRFGLGGAPRPIRV